MKKARLLAVVAASFLLAAACVNSGAPTSWEDNAAEYCPGEGEECEPNVGQAERNFRTSCQQAALESPDELARANPARLCKCGFDGVREEIGEFNEFDGYDESLRGDINFESDQTIAVSRIFQGCLNELGEG